MSKNFTLEKENEALKEKLERVLGSGSFEMHAEIADLRSRVMMYEVKHDNSDELKQQNKCLRKGYAAHATQFDDWASVTILIAARVRALEMEMEQVIIQWGRDGRLRNLIILA